MNSIGIFIIVCIFIVIIYLSMCSISSYTNNTHESFMQENPNATITPNSPYCSPPQDMDACMKSCDHGWCMDRQGGGKCVPGFLDGPFDPGVHCNNWWFKGMCLSGPMCRRTHEIPQPSLKRSWYHHPAPYYYRNIPWNSGTWCGLNRCYDKPVVVATVFQ